MESLKIFSRIQDTALTLESFDQIQHFPECGGVGGGEPCQLAGTARGAGAGERYG